MPVAQYGNFAPHVYIKRDELQNPCGETMTRQRRASHV